MATVGDRIRARRAPIKARIIDLIRSNPGLTAKDIAERISRRPEQVRKVAYQLGVQLAYSGNPRGHIAPGSVLSLGKAAKAAGLTLADIEAIRISRETGAP